MDTDIPDQVAEVLSSEDIEDIGNREGWAIGTVVLSREGEGDVRRIENAFIELFNGEGLAGRFGGVRFLAVDGGEYEESYAYANRGALTNSRTDEGWYVEEFTSPKNPNYGKAAPNR